MLGRSAGQRSCSRQRGLDGSPPPRLRVVLERANDVGVRCALRTSGDAWGLLGRKGSVDSGPRGRGARPLQRRQQAAPSPSPSVRPAISGRWRAPRRTGHSVSGGVRERLTGGRCAGLSHASVVKPVYPPYYTAGWRGAPPPRPRRHPAPERARHIGAVNPSVATDSATPAAAASPSPSSRPFRPVR